MPIDNRNPEAGDGGDDIDQAALERVLITVPKGAFVLAGLAVGALVLAWLGVYLFVFLPRGPVG